MPYVNVNNRRLFYTDQQPAAAGPALLLLHGAGGSHLVWPGALRRLAETRAVSYTHLDVYKRQPLSWPTSVTSA